MSTAFHVYWSFKEYAKRYEKFLFDPDSHAIVEKLYMNRAEDQLWIPIHYKKVNIKPIQGKSIQIILANDLGEYDLHPIEKDTKIEISYKDFMVKVDIGLWAFSKWDILFSYPVSRFVLPDDFAVTNGTMDKYLEKFHTDKWHTMYYDLTKSVLNIVLNK